MQEAPKSFRHWQFCDASFQGNSVPHIMVVGAGSPVEGGSREVPVFMQLGIWFRCDALP